VIDVQDPARVLTAIRGARHWVEKAGQVPNAIGRLLVELAEGLADSGPLELGISAGQWVRARDTAKRAVTGLRDDRAAVQVSEATGALGAIRRAFRLAVWSSRWRMWLGASRRALRIQFGVLALLAALIGALVESAVQPGGFHPIFLAVGPVVAGTLWAILLMETTARLGDAALAREAARELGGGQQAPLASRLADDLRLIGVQLVIATDQDMRVVRRVGHRQWEQVWSVPYVQITSFRRMRGPSPAV
jgi:hypothetical protein